MYYWANPMHGIEIFQHFQISFFFIDIGTMEMEREAINFIGILPSIPVAILHPKTFERGPFLDPCKPQLSLSAIVIFRGSNIDKIAIGDIGL